MHSNDIFLEIIRGTLFFKKIAARLHIDSRKCGDMEQMDKEELLTVNELAALLKCSKLTIYGLVARKKIPYKQPTRRLLRFRKSEIMAWIDGGQVSLEKPTISDKRKSKRMGITGTVNVREIVELAKKEILEA